MKQSGTSKNWGGRRANSGRKPADLSEAEVKELIKEFKKLAKETGKPIGRLLAEIAYDQVQEGSGPLPVRVGLKAIELYYTFTVTKKSHRTVEEHKITGPTICLPPIMERPKEKEEHKGEKLH